MKPHASTGESIFPSIHDDQQHLFMAFEDIPGLTDQQLINHLRSVVRDQEKRIFQFQTLLLNYAEKIKGTQKKFETEKSYNDSLFLELERAKKENGLLKVQIGLLKSDNLILRSKLSYSQQNLSERSNEQKQNIESSAENKNSLLVDNKCLQFEIKMRSIRKAMVRLIKALEGLIINNDQEEGRIVDEVSELMKYLK